MNLLSLLLSPPSQRHSARIIAFVKTDARRFAELMRAFSGGPYRVTQRAALPFRYYAQHHPEMFKLYMRSLIQTIARASCPVSVKRNTIRLFQFLDVPKSLHGPLIDICFKCLKYSNEPVAVKVFAMTVLFNQSQIYPDLKPELKVVIEDLLRCGGPALQSRGRKVLARLH